ncbi:MAG: hypothetical protein AAF790_03045, partial [Planctomycetota bacterium]
MHQPEAAQEASLGEIRLEGNAYASFGLESAGEPRRPLLGVPTLIGLAAIAALGGAAWLALVLTTPEAAPGRLPPPREAQRRQPAE